MRGLLLEPEEDRPAHGRLPGDGAEDQRGLAAGGLSYQPGRVTVRHMLDVIPTTSARRPSATRWSGRWSGLRVADYYGCQVVRPISAGDAPSTR